MTEVEVHLRNGHAEDSIYGGNESKGICNCCPYGYHIDLDFVRFCEKLAKASGEPSLSKKMRRERRRQRQSMEVLLGLTTPVIWNIEQLLPSITQERSPTIETPPPMPIKYSPLHHSNDGLNKAVLDFEATLERTSTKKRQKKEVSELDAMIHRRIVDFDHQVPKREEKSPVFRSSQEMIPFVELDAMSMYNSCGDTGPGPLQNIREQMAISLKRMRELEEKVKVIPSLETQVDSLKNEKNQLLQKVDQLKLSLRHAENNLDVLKSVENKTPTKVITIESKPSLRDVAISCRVLTRDVGITPIVQKNRTVGTVTSPEVKLVPNGFPPVEVKKPFLKSIKSQIQPEIETRSTITDLYMRDIPQVIDKKEIKLSQKRLDGISLLPRSFDRLNKGVQTTTREPTTILQVIEKREIGVQVSEPKKQSRDAGFTAKPKLYDTSCDVRPKTREYGCSDDRTTDLLCDKCKNLKTRSVGVGYGNVKLEDHKMDATLINRSKSFQLNESKPKIMTRSVGVGTMVPVKKLTSTKGVGTHDLTGITTKHASINTTKVQTVDVGSGSDKTSDIIHCEKCHNKSQESHRPKVTTNTTSTQTTTQTTSHRESSDGSAKDLHPSRIPRPKSNQTTPVMERKKFIRQDTYTKLPHTSSTEAGNKTKTRVKSTPDKLESPTEEKVDVLLRKKTKPSLGQSPTSVDKSISKDLKDLSLGSSSERYSAHFDDFYFDYDGSYDDSSKRNSALYPDHALFQPIQDEPREKIKPSKEMKAAMKVVNDSLSKYPNGLPKQLKNASNIIQQEWFKISSTATANPLDVEDYLDCFEEVSSTLLEFIVNMVDNNGNTAMHYAVSHGNFDVVSILLDSKVCNINKMNAAGYTCIMLVSLAQVRSETHRQVVKRLFHLADVNIRAKQHGQTALMLAVSHGRLDMVKLLLEAGADPNIQDGDGSTALMCAAEHGHLEIVKHILSHPECDTAIVDCDGSTALAIAMEAGNRDIGVLLYAREHFTSSRGNSPYASLRQRRSRSSCSPHPRTPTSPNPNRKSDQSM